MCGKRDEGQIHKRPVHMRGEAKEKYKKDTCIWEQRSRRDAKREWRIWEER